MVSLRILQDLLALIALATNCDHHTSPIINNLLSFIKLELYFLGCCVVFR